MFKFVTFFALLVVIVAAKKPKKPHSSEEHVTYVGGNVLRDLRITNLGLPTRYNQDFVDQIQSFVGQFVLVLDRMKSESVSGPCIQQMEKYQQGFVNRINNFVSLDTRSTYVDKITDYCKYLTQQTDHITKYIDNIKDRSVQFYFYNMMLNMISSRTFFASGLNDVACIYGVDQGVPVVPVRGSIRGSSESGSSEEK